MAIGKASDFKIYNDQFFGGLAEQADQVTAALGSVGIVVRNRPIRGDFDYQSFIKKISTSVTRRDTTSTSAATDLSISMDETISVKLNRKVGPIAQTYDAWRKAAMPFADAAAGDADGAAAFSRYLGSMLAGDVAVEMLNTGLLGLRAAIEGVSGAPLTHTIATNGTMTNAAMVSALSKMGDRASQVVGWVMHSKAYFDLMGFQVAPSTTFDPVAAGILAGGSPATMGRPVYVTDSPSLIVTGTPDLYRTLGVTAGGVLLETSEEQELAFDRVTGLENLVARLQGEHAYNLSVKGFKWDVANGGVNPASATIGTGSNWDRVATSNKDLAGVVIISG